MKFLQYPILLVFIIFGTSSLQAETDLPPEQVEKILSTFKQLDDAQAAQTEDKRPGQEEADILSVYADTLEALALEHPDHWLANYYASYGLIQVATGLKGKAIDKQLDRAQVYLDKASALQGDTSELHVLQAMLISTSSLVSPMMRGPKNLKKSFKLLDQAEELNPDNPRLYHLRGNFQYYLPGFMGGGKKKARANFDKAEELFVQPHPEPLWPSWGERDNKKQLAKYKK